MDHNQTNDAQNAAESSVVPTGSESFRTLPKASESFGTVRNDSERFGNVPHPSERKQNHTLTVREASRMFEAAGVARTERSIVNWCQPNRQGIPRLDSYFDPNERRYYITPGSVEMAIAEEKARAAKINAPSEPFGTVPNDAEGSKTGSEADDEPVKELERENLDLKIANRGKDLYIGQLQKEREDLFEQLVDASRKVGQLETKLLQLEGPEKASREEAGTSS